MKLVSTATELSVVRSICVRDPAVSGTLLAGLDSTYLSNDWTKEILSKITEHTRETGEVPQWRTLTEDPTIDEDIRKRMRDTKVERVKTRVDAISALKALNNLRIARGLVDLNDEVLDRLKKKKVDLDEVIAYAGEQFSQLRQTRSIENFVISLGTKNNATPLVKEILSGTKKNNFVPTCFDTFDKENGGITREALFTLGGSSGAGKSALASQLAINWSKIGETVVLVPLEMSEEEQLSRILANVSGIDIRSIIYNKLTDKEKKKVAVCYKKYVKQAKEAGGSYKIFKPQIDMTIEEIMASIHPLAPDIVIIDYVGLLKGTDGDDSWQKLGAIARYCKVWAANNNKIVVLLCQVDDEGKIRYARSIAEHSNYCWTFVATKATLEAQILSVEQLKARNGSRFPFNLKARLDVMQVRDLEIDEKQELEAKVAGQRTQGKSKKFGKGRDKRQDNSGAGAPPIAKKTHTRDSYLQDVSSSDDED